MKKYLQFLIIILCLIWMDHTYAQRGKGLNQDNMTKLYDPATVETVIGAITKVDTVHSGLGRFPGVLLTLENEDKEYIVYIAPLWYLKDQQLVFSKEKIIKTTGSRIIYTDNPLIISREIIYEENKMEIREENGVPVWAGKRLGPGKGFKKQR